MVSRTVMQMKLTSKYLNRTKPNHDFRCRLASLEYPVCVPPVSTTIVASRFTALLLHFDTYL